MAEKARLEADKLDAELTLSKIEKLEKQLLKSKKDAAANGDNANANVDANANANANVDAITSQNALVADLQYELDVLQAKVRGEALPVKTKTSTGTTPVAATTTTTTTTTSATNDGNTSTSTNANASTNSNTNTNTIQLPTATIETLRTPDPIKEIDNAKVMAAAEIVAENDTSEFNNIRSEQDLNAIPGFILNIVGSFVDMTVEPGSNGLDKTEFLRRWEMTRNLDYSFYNTTELPRPSFTPDDIRRKKVQILEWADTAKDRPTDSLLWSIGNNNTELMVTKIMIQKSEGDATQLAIYSLEYDYYMYRGEEVLSSQKIENLLPEALKGSMTEVTMFGQMYPKCVNNRGEKKPTEGENAYVSEEPTEAMVTTLTQTILPAIKFSTSAKPYKVAGGYAITGSHKYDTGDALIEAIDQEIAKSRPNLKDQLTVLYGPKYGPLEGAIDIGGESLNSLTGMSNSMSNSFFDETSLEAFAYQEPILFVAGPNLTRDANPLGLVLTSILGLSTSWYLSIYPFLLNDKIASRIDSDMQLLEANLQPDLSYLTELSIPLFYCFMSLQLVHELAHYLTATSKGVKLSVPVFVPSFITGVTSTVTTFKTLPKNKNDMFDIAAAGPLAGIACSSLAVLIGAKLTLLSDPATLPALPLGILRQSTLGGAIIDGVIPGSLYVPEGAASTAGGIMIPLHPVALAGYVGLIINALALLPIGTTDGGRLTMALFDRAEKISIGVLTMLALFLAGIFGSDLFLFYFSFCLAFQTGNEVPARNEQDPVDFSRVAVALVCYVLAILTLVPVQ